MVGFIREIIVKEQKGNVDADYVHTHFSLKRNSAIATGDIYIYGALTDWQIKPEAKMSFNQLELQYEADLYLKQGLYNYMYVLVQDGNERADMTFIEGSHFETEERLHNLGLSQTPRSGL